MLEHIGMACLTVGPLLNLFSCSFIKFHNIQHPFIFRRKWMISELLEITGILFLDISCIDMEEHFVFLAEFVGFAILSLASALNLIFPNNDESKYPIVGWKTDMTTSVDCSGLLILTVVAFAQFLSKLSKSKRQSTHGLLPLTKHDIDRDPANSERLQHRGYDRANHSSNGHYSNGQQEGNGANGDSNLEKRKYGSSHIHSL